MRSGLSLAILGLLVLWFAASARANIVSYDASSDALPSAPDFVRWDADNLFGAITGTGYDAPQSVSGGIYSTGPTDQSKYTFWYNDTLTLDHTKTVEISARLKLDDESSANPTDRAGLALGLTDDRDLYEEMYIDPTEVFINKTGRVRDVAFSLDATQWHDYTLRLQGNTITVDVDGITELTGAIFDATGSGAPTLANWAVVGDITSSASSSYEMTSFSVAVVPEPASISLLAIGLGIFIRRGNRSTT